MDGTRLILFRDLKCESWFFTFTGLIERYKAALSGGEPFQGGAAARGEYGVGCAAAGDVVGAGGAAARGEFGTGAAALGAASPLDCGPGDADQEALCACLKELMEISERLGFEGNLWHCFLTYLMVSNENAYSRACEMRGEVEGSINAIASHDLEIFRSYFSFDLKGFLEWHGIECADAILSFRASGGSGRGFNRRIRDRILELCAHLEAARDAGEFKDALTAFYLEYGVGSLGLHKAFRIARRDGEVEIRPITNIAHVHLDDLVGYEIAKKKLIDNTEAFVSGREANNCLLYGDAGTGKSSSIKAIANQYFDRGLRLIEVYKHQFADLHDVIALIKDRNYKFILYMDDLSFEEFETDYKFLKAVIEGGLEKKPRNVLIYATSNRRHLIRESFSDKEEVREDMHSSDTVQEKLSLYDRFGVTIYFGAPSKKEFQQIVISLARRNGIMMEEGELLAAANQWELGHGGLSGRTAQQFIDYLLGQA